jgi:hypothetical protein
MLRAYAAERLPLRLLLPVGVALALAAGGDRTVWELAADAVLALSLVVQFRIWDDIADRKRDAIGHPSRVLVRTAVRPFEIAAVALGVANLAYLTLRGPGAATLFVVLTATLAVWYGWRAGHTAAGTHLLLAKYPAFVAMIAAMRTIEQPALLAVSLIVVYGAACIYEAWHDPASGIFRLKAEATKSTPVSWLPPSGGRSTVPSPKKDAADIGVRS